MKRSFYRRRVRPNEGAVIFVMGLLLSLLVVLLMTQASPAAVAARQRARAGNATSAVSRPVAGPGARAGATSTAPAAAKHHPTTLEEITIQGEIDVPQVLFITGRPRPLYDDGLYRLFRPTPQRLLEEVTLPSEIFLQHPNTPRAGGKEVVR